MLLCQKIAYASSFAAGVGTAVGAMDPAPLSDNPALKFAGGALATAIIAGITPMVLALINKWGDKRVNYLENEVKTLKVRADEADRVEKERDEAKIEVVRYQERLKYLEGKVERNSSAVENVKDVIRKDVLTGKGIDLSPVASIVTDAYGKVLTASGQIEFILQWKPDEMIGRNIREFIPKSLHPDPVSHESRSFNPAIEFPDRTIQSVEAKNKEGNTVIVDVMLTRWCEHGQPNGIRCIRFGKLIRKHTGKSTTLADPFPPIDEFIPGIPREVVEANTAAIQENSAKLTQASEKLDTIIGPKA